MKQWAETTKKLGDELFDGSMNNLRMFLGRLETVEISTRATVDNIRNLYIKVKIGNVVAVCYFQAIICFVKYFLKSKLITLLPFLWHVYFFVTHSFLCADILIMQSHKIF